MSKQFRHIIGASLMALALSVGAASAQTYTAKIGKVGGDADTPENLALLRYSQIVKQRTNGDVDLQIFLGGQLGDDAAVIEGMQLGSVEGGLNTVQALSSWVPQGDVWALPFMFDNGDELLKAVLGAPGDKLAEYYEAQGFHVAALWPAGARNPVGHFPFATLDEIKGKKIRVVQSQLAMQIWNALGANPTPMPWPEVASAIETKAIDGFDTLGSAWQGMKLYESAPYYTHLDATWVVYAMVFSKQWWDSLPAEDQEILTKAAREMAVFQSNYLDYFNVRGPEVAAKAGGTVVEVTDKAPFRDAVADVWANWAGSVDGGQELIDLIQASNKG